MATYSNPVVAEVSPLTKSDDSSDAYIDEIECYPREYDCRNNTTVSESYSKFEQDVISIFMKDLQATQSTVDQQRLCIEQQLQTTKEQYENKLSVAKLMIKQMNYHHHLQEQKYMHEVHTLREYFNVAEQKWKTRMSSMNQQLLQQQNIHQQAISSLKEEIEKNNAQTQIYATESKTSVSNFERARLELNEMIQANQIVIQGLETKITNQNNDMLTLRTDMTAEKEETEQMVQSWMTQCETLQQQIHDIRSDLTTTNQSVQDATVTQNEIRECIQKMGQTYEKVLENVMEQIQEQTDAQSTNFNQVQNAQDEFRQQVEQASSMNIEKFSEIGEKVALQQERIISMHAQNEKLQSDVATLEQNLTVTNKQVVEYKDLLSESTDQQQATQTDLTDLQSIVAKLADASNNRFTRMETSLQDEMKSVTEIKQTVLSDLETYQQRVKTVDNKMVIHSIQLGEMSKEIKDISNSVTSMNEHHQKKVTEVQQECQAISKRIQTNNDDQMQFNSSMNENITKIEATSKDLGTRSTVVEKIIDTMTARMDQFDNDHNTTRGNFMVQHQNIETTVSEQLKQIVQQIHVVEQSSQSEVRSAADLLERKIKDHQGKIEQHDTMLTKFGAQTQSAILTIQDHSKNNQSIEANFANLQKDIKDIKHNVEKLDQNHIAKVNEHVEHTKNQFHKIINVVLPEQLESQKMLRARVIESENRMKERHETSYKMVSDRVDQVQANIQTMNGMVEALSNEQNSAKTHWMTLGQSIEQITADLDAVNEAFTSEIANIIELKSKLCDVESSLETQSSDLCQFKSAMDSQMTEIRSKQDQSSKDMNHSLSQVLSLSQMKEVMMKQINECLTRLSILDTATTEQKNKVVELLNNIGEHEVKLDTISKEGQTQQKHIDLTEKSTKIAIDALLLDVQKNHEVQKGVNDFVSQSIASCTLSISDLDKRTNSMTSNLNDITKKIIEHIDVHNEQVTEMKSVVIQQRHDQESSVDELKLKIERHSDRLRTAKDARIVIRSDLKKLVETMNDQFDQLRNQMEENKSKIEEQLESLVQTRETPLNDLDDGETLSRIDYLAGKIKAVNEYSKSIKGAIDSLKEEIEQWKSKSEQEMSSHVEEMYSKIELLTGKFKSMNENSKSTYKSIALIQDEIHLYKNDKVNNEKTEHLVEEISTKIDYLAGKFKSMNENSKTTNETVHSLQGQVHQLNEEQVSQFKQLDTRITKQEQIDDHLSEKQLAEISEVAISSVEKINKDLYESLLTEFNEFKVSFNEFKTEAQQQSTTKNDVDDEGRENLECKVEVLMQQIEMIVQQVQNLESEQHTAKAIGERHTETMVDQIKDDVDRLSRQLEDNAEELNSTKLSNQRLAIEVRGMKDRQTKYKNTIMKQHGQLKELVSVIPTVKHSKDVEFPAKTNDREEIYLESRDVDEMVSPMYAEHRDQE
jgi:golgin subfamily B member 1